MVKHIAKTPAVKVFMNLCHEIHLIFLGLIVVSCMALYFILFIPALIWRPIIKLYAKHYRKDFGDLLPLTGNLFSQVDDEDYDKTVIVLNFTADGYISKETAVQALQEKLLYIKNSDGTLKYPQFQQYMMSAYGFKFWVWDKTFHVGNHVKVRKCTSVQEVEDLKSELVSGSFEKNRSPWDITLVPEQISKEGKSQTFGFFRLHHGMADGYSLLFMFREFFGESKDPYQTQAKFISPTLMHLVKGPYQILRLLGELVYNTVSPFLWKFSEKKKSKTYRLRVGNDISTSDVKQISKKHGVSFSSVVYSIWTGGIHEYLSRKKNFQVPETLPCITLLPIQNHPKALENKFSFALTPLPIEEPDRLKRLKCIHDMFESIRNSPLPIIGYWVCLLHGCNFNFIGKILNSYKYSSFFCTYFPVIEETASDWKIGHCDLVDVSFFMKIHQGDTGIVMCISSYRGKLRFTPVVTSSLMSQEEVDEISRLIDQEINVLLKHSDESQPHDNNDTPGM